MDVFAGSENVEVKRVNDPSRDAPGDVVVRRGGAFERCFEVRDKPVSREDLYHFVTRVAESGGGDAIMVAVSANQGDVPVEEVCRWGYERGVSLSVFFTWDEVVSQALLWSATPALEAANMAAELIRARLVLLEVEPASIDGWIFEFDLE